MTVAALTDLDTLKAYFEAILKRSLSTPWVKQPEFLYTVTYDNAEAENLSGLLEVRGQGRKSQHIVTLLKVRFENLADREAIDDWLAHHLSLMLKEHIRWPM